MKKLVATIQYTEWLPSGSIAIGDNVYDQNWNVILPALGYNRSDYTYTTEVVGYTDEEALETVCLLHILKKDK